MNEYFMLLPILVPLGMAVIVVLMKRSWSVPAGCATLLAALGTLAVSIAFFGKTAILTIPVSDFGMGLNLSLKLYPFNSFIVLAAAGFTVLISLYTISFMRGRHDAVIFFGAMLLTLALVNGAVLADNLLLLLFFWEALLVTMYVMIAIGRRGAYKTATKAFIIVGVSDLCMMFGIALTGISAGTLTISQIALPHDVVGGAAFILLVAGAVSKAGSMPFHAWIPDAAQAAHLPFMAILPASLEKLLGIYFLARICLDFYRLDPGSPLSYVLMVLGCITIVIAVLMALIQKEYKKLLSYHAISQVGYMVLGIGTALPVGIIGGLFHMINHAMYKSCLFLTAGAVEHQTGTTDLADLGGLVRRMPVTFACFFIAAASISGVPPFNGFFSKELVYDAALERGLVFYIAAILGSFFTAASFLKLGHSAYFGAAHHKGADTSNEAPVAMLVPMGVLSVLCVLFGVFYHIPIDNAIKPAFITGTVPEFAGMPQDMMLIIMTCVVIGGAIINHISGVRLKGTGISSVDHIQYSPWLSWLLSKERENLRNSYRIGAIAIRFLARQLWRVDRAIDWIFQRAVPVATDTAAKALSAAHSGSYTAYIVLALIGAGIIIMYYLFI